ncbi:MAG: hypothetical protein DKM23_04100 [Candidatus Melainabacteria bacterium]|nr:MAG: hypothetical protein DKM23_04100 [Candidatus Melainabacteria bacterium]
MFNFKRLLALFTILTLMAFMQANAKVLDEVYSGVSDGQMIYYSFCSDKWYYQRPDQKKKCILEVTRRVSEGSGSYSEYVSPMYDVYTPAGSNYEFLYKGRLITYHIFDVKFYEIVYNHRNKQFIEVPLEENFIKEIFKHPKIIYISQFNDNHELTVRKRPFKKQRYLLLNDTDKYFYRYTLETPNKSNVIKNLFFVKKRSDIDFAHFMEDVEEFPMYKIHIKNGLKF